MYTVELTYKFNKDFSKQDRNTQLNIYQHIKKIKSMGFSKKHLKYGLPFFVEKISSSSRLLYSIIRDKKMIYILRFFKNHKNYTRYLNKFK